jgi:predicted AlkP superfamily phosphohydrolase/phosphomutase
MKKWAILSFVLVFAVVLALYIRRDLKPGRPKILLIGFDGASWNLMGPLLKQGKLPNFQKLIRGGSTASLSTLTPTWSPLLWTSIATGKRPEKHGIRAHHTPAGKFEVEPGNRRITKAFWNILSDAGIRVGVVNWWLTWPVEKVNGFIVSDKYRRTRKRPQLTYPPELLNDLPKVGIGMDVFEAEKRKYFLPPALEATVAVQDEKRMNYKIYWGQDRAIFQTSELLLKKNPVDVFATLFRIVDISSHLFCNFLPKETLNDESYSKLLEPVYVYADQILGELLARAGPQARVIICSDHGFQLMNGKYDHNARENPPAGVLILYGPEFRENYRVSRASILDVTPTLLHLMNLPVGKDMDGKVLDEAFTEGFRSARKIQYVATHDGKTAPETAPSLELDEETKEDFRALGYVQ